MSIFFLLLLLLPSSFSTPLVLHPLPPPSLCLDGSPYSVYYSKGDINNILISFWGGGLCEGRNKTSFFSDCLARSKTELGSSKTWPESKTEENGFLSDNEEENPNFYNWNKFDFPYCDGSFHQGYMEEGVEVEGEQIFIRGRKNVEEGIKFITNTIDLRMIRRVVVTGVSTGGYATFSWITRIEEIFKGINKDIEVYGVPDSGFFVDYYNYETKDRDYYIMNKLFYEIVNKEAPPLTSACLKDHPNEQDLCLFPEYIFQYVKIPLLILQAGYDSSNLYETVGLHCVDGDTLANCNADSVHYAHIFKTYQNELMKQGINKSKHFSVWAPACVTHGFEDKVHSSDWEVPMGSGFNVNKAVEQFLANPLQQLVQIEDIKWPENKGIQILNNLTVPAASHVALQCKVENPIESYDEGTLTVSLEFRLRNYGDSAAFDIFLLNEQDYPCYISYTSNKTNFGCDFLFDSDKTYLGVSAENKKINLLSTPTQIKNLDKLKGNPIYYIVIDNTNFPENGAKYLLPFEMEVVYHVDVVPSDSYYMKTILLGVVFGIIFLFSLGVLVYSYRRYRKHKSKNK